MKTFVACFLAFAATGVAPVTVDYRFDDVKRSVTLTTANEEKKVDRGATAHGGDKVNTGMFSYALIAAEHYHAKFEIFSSTKVLLASETPGVILSLERGRLRAMFDKITGSEPRIVQTPGALLAVRGTKYDVEVDGAGKTILDVWEGTVELQSPQMREPRFVHAGEESTFGRHEPPPPPHEIPDARKGNDPTRRPGDDGHQPPHNGGTSNPPPPAQPRGGITPPAQPPQMPPMPMPTNPPPAHPPTHH
jgi:hypothetical protein